MILVALGLSAETALFSLAGFAWLRSRDYTLAEAGAASILLVFMALSLIHQIDLFAGSPLPGIFMESIALVAVLIAGFRRRCRGFRFFSSAACLVRQETFPGLTIAGAWVVMAALVVVGWLPTERLVSVNAMGGGAAGSDPVGFYPWATTHPLSPLNAAALFYHTTRFGLSPDACGFGLLAHMAVGFSTYALARRYAWPSMALTVTLMVLSMPRLVCLGLHPTAELISAAAIAVSLVLLYRLVEQHQTWDLRFFVLCILFSIHANPMSVALVAVMTLLLTMVMIRRHGWLLWRELIVAQPTLTILLLLPAVGLAQVPVFALNLAHGHPPFGAEIAFDTDGIIGAAANLIRYLFISIDFTEPVRKMLLWLVGLDLNRLMMLLYNTLVVSLFGHSGATAPFVPVFSGSGGMGYGPFAPLLVLPAMVYAALRGPRRLKAVSVAWAGYLYLAALVFAWTLDNLAVLSPLFAVNGFVVAFSLPPWRLRRRGMRLLQVLFACLLAGALAWGRHLRL